MPQNYETMSVVEWVADCLAGLPGVPRPFVLAQLRDDWQDMQDRSDEYWPNHRAAMQRIVDAGWLA